jgi:hypothetical protein
MIESNHANTRPRWRVDVSFAEYPHASPDSQSWALGFPKGIARVVNPCIDSKPFCLTAKNLLSCPPQRERQVRGWATGSEGGGLSPDEGKTWPQPLVVACGIATQPFTLVLESGNLWIGQTDANKGWPPKARCIRITTGLMIQIPSAVSRKTKGAGFPFFKKSHAL